jgi:hypothetical protein
LEFLLILVVLIVVLNLGVLLVLAIGLLLETLLVELSTAYLVRVRI